MHNAHLKHTPRKHSKGINKDDIKEVSNNNSSIKEMKIVYNGVGNSTEVDKKNDDSGLEDKIPRLYLQTLKEYQGVFAK